MYYQETHKYSDKLIQDDWRLHTSYCDGGESCIGGKSEQIGVWIDYVKDAKTPREYRKGVLRYIQDNPKLFKGLDVKVVRGVGYWRDLYDPRFTYEIWVKDNEEGVK